MRFRTAALVALAALLVAPGVPGANAAPHPYYQLTIAALPKTVLAGDNVLIYGRLLGNSSGAQTLRLYRRLAGPGSRYSQVGTTTTSPGGYYEFTRVGGAVYTNRSWFVQGPMGTHSRTVYERVGALVSLSASAGSGETLAPIVFAGSVRPDHAHRRVFLQQQIGSGDDWRTLTSTQLDGSSRYMIPYGWRRPGIHDVRVLIRRDARNNAGASSPLTVEIQQAQVRGFTITSSAPIAPSGSSVNISGALDRPGSTTPEPGMIVQLWGRRAGTSRFTVLADTTTASDGSYRFTESGAARNTVYQARTMRAPGVRTRRTAALVQGVQDTVTVSSSPVSVTAPSSVALDGTVTPDKAGRVVYLQRLGRDHDWHTVQVQTLRNGSTFQFNWQAGEPGSFTFRARIISDALNVGGHSMPVTVTVTRAPPSSLPSPS